MHAMQVQAGAPLIPSPAPNESTNARSTPRRLLVLVLVGSAALVYIADQLTKAWVSANLQPDQPRELIGSVLQLNLTRNPGAAFSILTGSTWILTAIACAVVVFIVITFGSNQGGILLASLGAVAAAVLVLGTVLVLRAPLSRVPENTLKFVVGSLLTSFGTFWGAEGAGVSWPGSDVALAVIIPTTLAISALMVAVLRRTTPVRATTRVGMA